MYNIGVKLIGAWLFLRVSKSTEHGDNYLGDVFSTAAVSLGTLRLVSKTMAQQVPTLSMVIPYLELSTKQGYLVDRIRGLN